MATRWHDIGERGISVGRVIGRAFGVIGDNPAVVLSLSFLLAALPQALGSIMRGSIRTVSATSFDAAEFESSMTIAGSMGLVYLLFSILLQGAMVRAVVAYAEGRRAGFGECVRVGGRVALPLLGLSILFYLAVGIGFVLLIVPGIMLFVRWSVAAPALVDERCGVFAALSRSAALTKGARWRIFGLMVLVLVVIWAITAVAAIFTLGGIGLTGAVNTNPSPVITLFSAALTTALSAFFSAIPTALYVELVRAREGPANDRLADVFA